MPIFEYHCNDCGTAFEVLERSNNIDKPAKCPRCDTHNTKKRFSAFATAGTQKETVRESTT